MHRLSPQKKSRKERIPGGYAGKEKAGLSCKRADRPVGLLYFLRNREKPPEAIFEKDGKDFKNLFDVFEKTVQWFEKNFCVFLEKLLRLFRECQHILIH